ncbi:fungal-specific transcription factor domain-containing protein [Aspergillus bertholletiae]|uniref:Fungal-specific transcription factor domain-containing protein n=1 Tax=Aspergillus bertholletiae TaxID=1226010 RepID=A0A5N7BE71_9EURO|nr:fungal-specific transcription factor domain-containing protein [Aspergillus bertholletiae]
MSKTFRKRLKIATACDSCRARKTKCDGGHARSCSLCVKRDAALTCRYTKDRGDEITSENLLHKQPNKPSALAPPPAPQCFDMPADETAPLTEAHTSIGPIPGPVLSYNRHVPFQETRRGSSRPIDPGLRTGKMLYADAMNGIVGDRSPTPEAFGNSSAGSFMRQIKAAIDSRLGVTQSANLPQPESPHSRGCREHKKLSLEYSACLSLPPRRLADHFMQCYWDLNWVLYPFVNRCDTEADYRPVWSGDVLKYDERTFMCILNMLFALGSQYSDALLYDSLNDVVSTEATQCLLLMGVWLQSTSNVHESWMTIGQAIRMVQSVGLHLPQYYERLHSMRQKEFARRIWHGCVSLDRVLSMTFGRPGMIPKWLSDSTPLPAMIDDEFLDSQTDSSAIRPDSQPAIMAFTVKTLELYEIMNDTLVELYMKTGERGDRVRELTRILELDERLQTWKKSLPSQLQDCSTDHPIFQRQASITHLRYLHVRILLFRPAHAQSCIQGTSAHSAGSHDESLSQLMFNQCSSICYKVAHDLIGLYSASLNLGDLLGPLPAWWYSILYIYTAATVILAERLTTVASGEPRSSHELAISQTWESAIRILKAYSMVGESADRYVAALEILSAKLPTDFGRAYPAVDMSNDSNPDGRGTKSPVAEWDPGYGLFGVDDLIWLNTVSGNLY